MRLLIHQVLKDLRLLRWLALAWILPPLLRRRGGRADVARSSLNLGLLREQLAELAADLASGILTQEKYEWARLIAWEGSMHGVRE